jgi:hypothetical protein
MIDDCSPMVVAARRILLVGALIAGAMALNVWATGGFSADFGLFSLSSRNPERPLVLGLILAAGWLLLRWAPGGRTTAAAEWTWWRGRLRFRPVPPLVVLACLCVAADVAQWWRGAPLWLDEQMIAINLRDRSFPELPGTLWLGQSAPLGWLWFERTMLVLFGPGERVLRFVPLLFGAGTVAAAAWIGRRWLTPIGAFPFVLLCWIGATLSHYRFEVKHYAADVFFALLLPALAVWTTEASSARGIARRQLAWAAAAGAGLWFGNGALFVAPGCLLWMLWSHARTRDLKGMTRLTVAGLVWFVFFAGHYALSLRYTHENAWLRSHWANRLPPVGAGPLETITWFGPQLAPAARDAGGTRLPVLFWIAGAGGLILGRRHKIAAVYATVPAASFVLAAARLVPFYERFFLWVTPALYAGIALALMHGAGLLLRGVRQRRLAPLLAGGAAAAVALVVSGDVVERGWRHLDLGIPPDSNHGMDDRGGVRWLMQQRLPGDAIVSTRLGLPAIWWYGRISLADHPDGRLPDGSTFYELSYDPAGRRCAGMEEVLQGHRRVLLYISFPDLPDEVFPRVEREVLALGTLAGRRTFTSATWAAVVRIEDAASAGTSGASPPAAGGCLDLRPARRW